MDGDRVRERWLLITSDKKFELCRNSSDDALIHSCMRQDWGKLLKERR